MASLKGLLADADEESKRWSRDAAAAQKALEQEHGAARELANQASTP